MAHVKETISLDSLLNLHEEFRKIYNSYKTFVIAGNHDMILKKDMTMNFTKVFSDCKNVTHINSNYEYFDFKQSNSRLHFVPFNNAEEIIKTIKDAECHRTFKNYLFGHFGVRDFFYQEDGYTDKQDIIEKELFRHFEKVFLGHFHAHQTQDNITFVSSPYQQRFGDDGGKFGFTFLDLETEDFWFEENIHSPRFIQLDLNKENLKYASTLANNFIRFKVDKNIDKQTIFKIKLAIEKTNFEVSFDYNLKRTDTKIVKLENWNNLISKDASQIVSDAIDTLDETEETKTAIKEIILSNDKKTKNA